MAERMGLGCRDGKTDQLTELENLIEALTRYKATPRPLQQPSSPLEEQADMNTLKRIWTALNSDITPHLQDLKNQLAAIYDPQLVPVTVGDMTIEWVDRRTGERPWF